MTGWLFTCFVLVCLCSVSLALDECPTGWFVCGNGRCVAGMWICDGEDDCGNNMDELDCDKDTEHTRPIDIKFDGTDSAVCERYQFECKDNKRCIPKTWVCDGHPDCTDGSDEECNSTDSANDICDGFQCPDHTCIPLKWKCDGEWDCKKGEDEAGCKIVPVCRSDQFVCNNGSCLDEYKVCDGHQDCSLGEDEGSHCKERLCRNLSCSHDCHVEPSGARCLCREGYELAKDKKTCNDIDECKREDICSQRCVNVKGAYLCMCIHGYSVHNNSSCQADGDEPLLIFSTTKEIRGMWTRRQRYFPIARSRNQALGVAFDGLDRRVYWVEVKINEGRIMSCSLDGTDLRPVLSNGLQHPEDVVVDWLARNMYITDAGLKQVLACKLDGSYCTAVIKENVDQPRAVVLDPRKGLMYWTDWGTHPGIFQAGMDGTSVGTLVNKDVAWPNGISLDLPSNRMYWCDGKLKRFESIGLDGKDRKLILAASNFHPYSLGVFEDTLYWSDWATYSIDSCHKTTGKNQTLLLRSSRSMVMGVHVYHPVQMTRDSNPCWSSRCSHLCLLAKGGGTSCSCPAGYALDSDGKTCLPVRSSPFLLAAEDHHVWHIHPESVGEDIVTELPIGKVTTIGDIAFDWSTMTLYLSDVHKPAIFALNTTTYRMKPFISKNLDAVESIQFDWLGHNLYWVDAGTGLVEVAHARNESTRTTLLKNLSRPMGISLFPEKGTMYIVTAGKSPTVTECNMDGQNCKALVSRNMGVPVSVTVIPSMGRVFWADAKLGTIESSDFQGQSRTKNQMRLGQVMSVASSDSTLYWTDTDQHLVHFTRHDASLGIVGNVKLPLDHNGSAIIRIDYFSPPPDRKMGPCATRNGGCSHLCLANPSGFACFCPAGYELASNKKQCTVVQKSCQENQFRCVNSSECIPINSYCDGLTDCDDGSDESHCEISCPAGDFRCDNGKCLLSTWKCDGLDDCLDGSDERNCSRQETCKSSQFSCNDGHCLSSLWRCDGEKDCSEGEDEIGCEMDCDTGEFACKNGACIPGTWACDGDFDCPDKSDERDCGASTTCGPGEMRCGDGMCLDKNVLCDRRKDCEDGSDEAGCEYEIEGCPKDAFTCNDFTCIYLHERCDGIKDCATGEDEANCSYCKEFEFYCQQTGRCIPSSWTCDGMDDCGDGEDERLPSCSALVSTTKDPNENCLQFTCESGDCVPWKKVCDDVSDCADGSDEGHHCGITCSLDNGGCSQKCRDTPRGPVCSCLDGYVLLRDGKTCDDVNECLIPGHCSQQCTNIKGGYKCNCVYGYKVTADGRRCKAMNGVARLLYLLPEEVLELSLEGQRKKLVMRGTETEMKSLDLDASTSTLFWTEKKGTLNALMNGSVVEIAALNRPHMIAYDWVAGNIYYTNSLSIGVCRRDGKYCTEIIKPTSFPQGLALAPPEGLMFWSISYNNVNQMPGEIYRAPMDGGNGVGKPIPTKVDWPTCLTIDPVSRRLYWIDASLHTLEVSDLDGYNRETLVSSSSYHPAGLALFEDFVFWSDLKTRHITRANKFTGGSVSQVSYIDSHPSSIKIMHPLVQPQAVNPCTNAKCAHLCLLKEQGYSCKCASGYKLWNSSKDCISAYEVDIHDGRQYTVRNCTPDHCLNKGRCVETSEGRIKCECETGFTGARCDYSIPLDDEEQPDYTLVAAVLLGSLAALVVLIIAVMLCKKYSRNIRVFGETLHVTFPNPLFDLLPKSGRLVVDTEDKAEDGAVTKSADSKIYPETYKSSTYVCNTGGPMSELYRGTSSDSVDSTFVSDNIENLEKSLLSAGNRPVRYMKRL